MVGSMTHARVDPAQAFAFIKLIAARGIQSPSGNSWQASKVFGVALHGLAGGVTQGLVVCADGREPIRAAPVCYGCIEALRRTAALSDLSSAGLRPGCERHLCAEALGR